MGPDSGWNSCPGCAVQAALVTSQVEPGLKLRFLAPHTSAFWPRGREVSHRPGPGWPWSPLQCNYLTKYIYKVQPLSSVLLPPGAHPSGLQRALTPFIFVWLWVLTGCHPRVRLPDLTNQNTRCPIKSESQINNEYFLFI